MYCGVNDLQHAEQQTVIYSSVYGGGNGFYITPENLWQAAVIFSVRRLIKPTWLNDRDQFIKPKVQLSDEFTNDCLIWMLFNRCNRTAGAKELSWNGQKWNLENHFIPFTESDVGATDRFESDFMSKYLADKVLSTESLEVLNAGLTLWRDFFEKNDPRSVREELKINRADTGWFQIRTALDLRNKSGDFLPVDLSKFKDSYEILTEKLQPKVFELGFLR
jgi:hypothetical protein